MRLELENLSEGGAGMAAEVCKRLATIRNAVYSSIGTDIAPLCGYRDAACAIVDHVCPSQPAEAVDPLWRLLDMASSFYERCEDSHGAVAVFADEVSTPSFQFADHA